MIGVVTIPVLDPDQEACQLGLIEVQTGDDPRLLDQSERERGERSSTCATCPDRCCWPPKIAHIHPMVSRSTTETAGGSLTAHPPEASSSEKASKDQLSTVDSTACSCVLGRAIIRCQSPFLGMQNSSPSLTCSEGLCLTKATASSCLCTSSASLGLLSWRTVEAETRASRGRGQMVATLGTRVDSNFIPPSDAT